MSPKPIDQVVKGQNFMPRDRIWKWLRGHKKSFTAGDILRDLDIRNTLSLPYLNGLVRAGHITLEYQATKPGEPCVFKFLKGPMATPRVRQDGSPVKHGAGQDNMWRTMQMLTKFTAQDLAVTSSTEDVAVSVSTAKAYIVMLVRAKYLRKVGEKPSAWCLVPSKNTGYQAPMVQRVKSVFDPNLGKVVWPLEGNRS
ncbi:hypothetical protein [Paremcibacter congregatus]|uniref:hypothetical protein n=1 Tax=Paremcibacter congregatus TaxID=2043170 RepID=UPI0030ED0840|tara:strand:+ start:1484 stop:2074 length:591 start_codon:yes stop_codon:yes gene_type:complete